MSFISNVQSSAHLNYNVSGPTSLLRFFMCGHVDVLNSLPTITCLGPCLSLSVQGLDPDTGRIYSVYTTGPSPKTCIYFVKAADSSPAIFLSNSYSFSLVLSLDSRKISGDMSRRLDGCLYILKLYLLRKPENV